MTTRDSLTPAILTLLCSGLNSACLFPLSTIFFS
jgi:hypothetical protein